MRNVVKYDHLPVILARPVSWLKGARRDFEAFPPDVQEEAIMALAIAALGLEADSAKPMKGLGTGDFEIALRHRGDAFRVVYGVQLGEAIWVLHAFQKKSKTGIKAPQSEIDLIHERLERLKETLR
ncbi:MAG: type II toxin-antitoxin system RelE/ParE family toxin [Roseiarcus sp.]